MKANTNLLMFLNRTVTHTKKSGRLTVEGLLLGPGCPNHGTHFKVTIKV